MCLFTQGLESPKTRSTTIVVVNCCEKLKSELFAVQFLAKEANECANSLQWELEVECRSCEQAEAEGASLKQQMQTGSKSRKLKCMLTTEAESTKEIRWLITAELERGQK